MARFSNGWIKLWRQALDKDLSQNVYLWALWHALLHVAVWKETQFIWNGKQIILKPGMAVIGIKEFSDRWKCSQRTISKWLKYLHDTGRIVRESCARGTLVTICNWDIYQGDERYALAPSAHEVGTKYELSSNQVGLIEEGKKIRKKEYNTYTPEKFEISKNEIQDCIEEWKTTLEHFEINRSISPRDEIAIGRAIQDFGTEWVKLAFQGARKQTKSVRFDPRNFVSLSTYLHRDRIERLVNIGAGKESVDGIDWEKVFGTKSGAA